MNYSICKLLLWTSFLLFSCTKQAEHSTETDVMQVTDDMGRLVSIRNDPARIISLTPSITELLYAFTDTTHIVGRSAFCDYPAEVLKKPAVNHYPVDIEGIVRLKPDLVLVMKGMISIQDLEKLDQLSIPVFVQKYDLVSDIIHSVRMLVKMTDGDSLKMEQWLGKLAVDSSSKAASHKSFVILASINPIYVFGKQTFASELAEEAGGRDAIDSTATAYPTVDVEYFLRANPDMLIFNSGMQPASFFETYPVLKKITAYKKSQYYIIDGSVLSRPGSRLTILKDSLTSIIHR